jgi:hypothetical protein
LAKVTTGDLIRAECADEIGTVRREVWLRPHFSERSDGSAA